MKRFGFILQVLWQIICQKDARVPQLDSVSLWQEQLAFGQYHPLSSQFENMSVTQAHSLVNYIEKREEDVIHDVLSLHAYEVFQAIQILNPDAISEFFNTKKINNETFCSFSPHH